MGVAEEHNPQRAITMKALGLSSGFIQADGSGSPPNNEYTFAVCFDHLSVVMAIRHLDPNGISSVVRVDCTMLGKTPVLVLPPFASPFDGSGSLTIVETADSNEYHTLLNITICKNYDTMRSDSQASGLLGDIEVHFHHPFKGGLSAALMEEALLLVAKGFNGALAKVKHANPNASLPSQISPKVAELDFGIADTKSVRRVWPSITHLIHERYHVGKVKDRFIRTMIDKGILSEQEGFSFERSIQAFLIASTKSVANQTATSIKNKFDQLIQDKVANEVINMDKQTKARQMFINTVCRYLLDNSDEVCNFRRNASIVGTITNGWGPNIELTNKLAQASYQSSKPMYAP